MYLSMFRYTVFIVLLTCAAWLAPAVLAVDTSGWDWEAIEGVDDAVVTAPRRNAPPAPTKAAPPNARPDFAAPTQPAVVLFPSVPAMPNMPAMPAFSVIPAVKDLAMHPCGNCHRWAKSNTTMRKLLTPHDNFSLQHGLSEHGKLWCFTCHDLTGNGGDGSLRTLDGAQLDYAESYVLCTQCHASQGRDWTFGAHGKRHQNWQGSRQIYTCTACHYPHAPAMKLRLAKPGPFHPLLDKD
jgi:hypothetical protein